MSYLNHKREIYDKIISDGRYMLIKENVYNEDFPDEFVTQEVFDLASKVVSILVNHNFTDVEMAHWGYSVDINGSRIALNVSKERIGGFCKLRNYSFGKNVVKFNFDIDNDWEDTLNYIIGGLGIYSFNERN